MEIKIVDRVGNICVRTGPPFDIDGLEIHGIPLSATQKDIEWVKWWVWFMGFTLVIDHIKFDNVEYEKNRNEKIDKMKKFDDNKKLVEMVRKQKEKGRQEIVDMGLEYSDADPGL